MFYSEEKEQIDGDLYFKTEDGESSVSFVSEITDGIKAFFTKFIESGNDARGYFIENESKKNSSENWWIKSNWSLHKVSKKSWTRKTFLESAIRIDQSADQVDRSVNVEITRSMSAKRKMSVSHREFFTSWFERWNL